VTAPDGALCSSMRLNLILQEAKALGLPPAPPPMKALKRLHLKMVKEEMWLKRKLATLKRAESYRGDSSKVEPLRAEILARLKGPIMAMMGDAEEAAIAYLHNRTPQDAKHPEIMRMETNLAGLQGKIYQLKPDFFTFYMDEVFKLLDAVSTGISIATAFYAD